MRKISRRLLAILLSLSLAISFYGGMSPSNASQDISSEQETTNHPGTGDGGEESSLVFGETDPSDGGDESGTDEGDSEETGSGESGSEETGEESETDPTDTSTDNETETDDLGGLDIFGSSFDTSFLSQPEDDDFDPDKPPYVPGMIKVGLAAQPGFFEASSARSDSRSMQSMQSALEATLDDFSGELLSVLEMGEGVDDIAIIDLPEDMSMAAAIAEYGQSPLVEYAEPIYLYYPMDTPLPNDSIYQARLSHHDCINTFEAWVYLDEYHPEPTAPVRVAVIDTQIALDHPDLAETLLLDLAKNYQINSTGQLQDLPLGQADNNHGSHVAGLIGATANNAEGEVGVAAGYSNNWVEIIPINVFHYFTWADNNPFSASDISVAAGINHAVENEAKIINLSLGGPSNSNAMRQAVESAVQQGVSVIAAAGNDGNTANPTIATYPSDWPDVISVINVTYNNSPGSTRPGNPNNIVEWRVGVNPRHSSSSYGAAKNVSAPGNQLWSTVPFGMEGTTTPAYPGYRQLNGTSMAAPVTTGVAALMLYANPELTPEQLAGLLYASATDVHEPGFDIHTGHGVLNAQAAVAAVMLDNAPPAPTNVQVAADGLFAAKVTWTPAPGASGYQIYRRRVAPDLAPAILLATESSPLADTFIDSSVIPGESYVYEVGTYCDTPAGPAIGERTEAATYTVFVPAPENFTAVLVGDEEKDGQLSWSGVDGAQEYILYRRDMDDNDSHGIFVELAKISGTSYRDDNIVLNSSYEYLLSVYAPATGDMPAREGSAARVIMEYRSNAPTGLEATEVTPFSVSLTWPAADATDVQYIIERTREDEEDFEVLATVTALTYTDDSVDYDTAYRYAHRTLIDGERSLRSTPLSVNTPALPIIEGLSANTHNPYTIKLTWEQPDFSATLVEYRIRRSDDINNKAELIGISPVSDTQYLDRGVRPGVNYTYFVQPIWEGLEETSYNTQAQISHSTEAPDAIKPSAATIPNDPGSIQLEWNTIDGASGYEISLAGAFLPLLDVGDVDAYTLTGLNPNTIYRIMIRPYWGAGADKQYGEYGTVAQIQTLSGEAPAGLRIIPGNPGTTTVSLAWEPVSGTVWGYRINRDGNPYDFITTESYTDYLAPGVGARYSVQACYGKDIDNMNSYGPVSATVTASPAHNGTANLVPRGLKVEGRRQTAIDISWQAPVESEADGFAIAAYRVYANHLSFDTANANTLSYPIIGLDPNSTYQIRVVPLWKMNDILVEGQPSGAVSAKTHGPAPKNLRTAGSPLGATAITLLWDAVQGDAEGPVVGYRINKNNVAIAYVSAVQTQYTDTFLIPGAAVRYTVQACWGDKDEHNPFGTKPGVASATRRVSAANPAPSGLSLVGLPTDFEAQIKWQGVAGAEYYDIYCNGVLRYWVNTSSQAADRQTDAVYLPSTTSSGTTTATLPMTPGQSVRITIRPVYVSSVGEVIGRASAGLSIRVPGGGTPSGFRVMSNKMSRTIDQANAVTPTSIRVQWNSMLGRNVGNEPGRYVLYTNGEEFGRLDFALDDGAEEPAYWHDITDLNPNTVYSIQVAALYSDDAGDLHPGVASKAARKRTGGPAPTGLGRNIINNTTVTLTWRPVSDANVKSYLVIRRDADGTEHKFPPILATEELELTDDTLRPGVNARYRVHACWAEDGEKPGIARQIQIRPKGKAPGNVRGSATTTTITVTWNPLVDEWAEGLVGYRVSLDDGKATISEAVDADDREFAFENLNPNSRYRVRVAGIYENERVGRQSGARTVRTASGAPAKLRASNITQDEAQLTWVNLADSSVGGYLLERTTRGSSGFEQFYITMDEYYLNRNGFIDQNLLPNTEYRYTVRAYWERALDVEDGDMDDTAGAEKVFGKTSTTLRVRTRGRW